MEYLWRLHLIYNGTYESPICFFFFLRMCEQTNTLPPHLQYLTSGWRNRNCSRVYQEQKQILPSDSSKSRWLKNAGSLYQRSEYHRLTLYNNSRWGVAKIRRLSTSSLVSTEGSCRTAGCPGVLNSLRLVKDLLLLHSGYISCSKGCRGVLHLRSITTEWRTWMYWRDCGSSLPLVWSAWHQG